MLKKAIRIMGAIVKEFSDSIYFNRLSSLEKASRYKLDNKKIDLNKIGKTNKYIFLRKKEK